MTDTGLMKLDQSIDIDTLPEVYDPNEDSYLMLKIVEVKEGEMFLEMGSGTGLTAIHAAKAGARVTAADINPNAVQCTRRNALKNTIRRVSNSGMRTMQSQLSSHGKRP